MDEFRVPKRRVPVEVVLPGGAVRRLVFFLSEFAADHPGRERVSDLLQRGGAFLPATDPETGSTTFLQCSNLALVRVPREEEEGTAEAHTLPTEHEVELTLVDGQHLRGLLTYVLPPDRSRLGDHLNEAPSVLRLLERDHVALVNKRFIVHVVPHPAS